MSDIDGNGMCVPYRVQHTPDKGRGVFAETPVLRGATVWRFVAGRFAVYDEESFNRLLSEMTDADAVYQLTHVHCMEEFPGYTIRVFDDGELINHADQPTLVTATSLAYREVPEPLTVQAVTAALMEGHFTLVAARDIAAGEELTLDYNADPDDPPYLSDLYARYGVSWDWL